MRWLQRQSVCIASQSLTYHTPLNPESQCFHQCIIIQWNKRWSYGHKLSLLYVLIDLTSNKEVEFLAIFYCTRDKDGRVLYVTDWERQLIWYMILFSYESQFANNRQHWDRFPLSRVFIRAFSKYALLLFDFPVYSWLSDLLIWYELFKLVRIIKE